MTEIQKLCYRNFLKSEEVQSILNGKRNLFSGIDTLRKICNHPDLLSIHSFDKEEDYGNWERSGKLIVLHKLLPIWKEQGNKVLLFSQTRQMLDIIEQFIKDQNFSYLRMDGGTIVKSRMSLVEEFNSNENIFLFLLSTRVGGLGLNLVAANRVIIFDPGKYSL